jgi:hypothetical protein
MILMERQNADGTIVTLRIDGCDRVSVRVEEVGGAQFEIPAMTGREALDVFHHPYLYVDPVLSDALANLSTCSA